MTRRERLIATLRGEAVDRPAVSFYEIGGYTIDPNDPDPFNVYSDPSWQPLLKLAAEETDIIRFVTPSYSPTPENLESEFFKYEQYMENGSRFTKTTIEVGGRTLTSLGRRDPHVHTSWTLEHLLKDAEDVRAYLELPDEAFDFEVDVSNMESVEAELGDSGIVMVDIGDPICAAASMFAMEDYTVVAYTERELFHALLQKHARYLHRRAEDIARKFPGRLWRIYGPEYATEPYLPPSLFKEYVVTYTKPMIDSIKKYGGFARIHSHGRIASALPDIVAMGADGLDPIEPAPQGDVELADVRRDYGKRMVLFGNLEVSDIENMAPADFEKVVAKSIADGTAGEGRGFVLMPSAAPYGRTITPTTLANYRTMVKLVNAG